MKSGSRSEVSGNFNGNEKRVAQREWNGSEEDEIREWDEVLAPGLQWHWDNTRKKLYYTIAASAEDSTEIQRLRKYERQAYTYEQWIKAGWTGLRQEQQPKLVEKSENGWEGKKAEFEGYAAKGREKYGLIALAARELSARTRIDRDDFFAQEYRTALHSTREKDNPYAPYNYKSVLKNSPHDRTKTADRAEKEGHYINEVNLAWGSIAADQNYGNMETYFDRDAGKAVRYSNSEVFYQQWKKAKESLPESGEGAEQANAKLGMLRRAHVSGDGIPVVKAVKAWHLNRRPTYNENRDDIVLTDADEGFYALLAAANCQAAIFLIVDHGKDLGIKGIKVIRLMKGESIEIDFTPD